MHYLRFFIFVFGFAFVGFAQESTPYAAGFKSIHLEDTSRIYKPGTKEGDRLHYRPVDLDLWYPASPSTEGNPMLFKDLFQLHEQRAMAYQDETDYSGISEELILYFAAGFGMEASDGKRLLRKQTSTYHRAPVAPGTFPLIVYMAGYNGMGWESYRLMEQLAENGFVVVSISSVGAYPGDMTNSLENTMEQVYDAEHALEFIQKTTEVPVDYSRKGLLGLSWGGMSGILLLDRHPDFKAMVSLDGTDTFYYGDTDQDDAYLSEIYEAGVLHPENTQAAFLHLEAGDRLAEFTPMGEYCYYKKISSPVYYLRFLNSRHADFGSMAWALETTPAEVQLYEKIMAVTLRFFQTEVSDIPGFETYYRKLVQEDDIAKEPLTYSPEKPTTLELVGNIVDAETRAGLAYVNIGVINREIGTVSNSEGLFSFAFSEDNLGDTLRISRIGYEAQTFPVSELLNNKDKISIGLKEAVSELDEIVLTAREWKRKTLGNKTESKFIGHLFHYGYMGKEMGVRMNVGRKPVFVDNFSFHISYNRFRARTLFRLNIYNLKGGKPDQNILKENIILTVVPEQTGRITVDLRPYDIALTEDVLVTLEWVDVVGEVGDTDALSVSVGVLTGGTYERNSKEVPMKKVLRGLGLGYTMDVRY